MNTIVIRNIDEAYVQVFAEQGLLYELREYFTFYVEGYKFNPKFRAKLWDGKIRLLDLRTNKIYRGLVPHIQEFCQQRNYEFGYEDEVYDVEFSIQEALDFIKTLNIPLDIRDYQLDAFVNAIRKKRTLLLSPTASGKSLIIYLIIRYLNLRTLIIVPTISLVSQLHTDFLSYGFIDDDKIHKVFGGEERTTDKQITISTWQSLYTLPKKFFLEFDVVIADEAHLFQAKSLSSIMTNLVNAKHRIGTTGTLSGSKTNKLVLEGLLGKVYNVISTKDLMDKKFISDFNIKCILLKHNDEICQRARKFSYQEEIQYLVLNESRNKFIINLALSLKGNTLILYQYVEKHGKILNAMLIGKETGITQFFIHGGVGAEAREDVRRLVENVNRSITIASYGTFSTGINIKNLHNIIFASPSKSRIRNLQSIGRGLRKADNKTTATLYDISDDLRHKKHTNFTLNHFYERIKIYSEEKFDFKTYKVQIKE